MSAPPVSDRTQTPVQRRPVYRLPLLRAALAHGADLVVIHPAPRPVHRLGAGPFIAIVDDRSPSRGPAAFDLGVMGILLERARGVLVLTGDCARSYGMAASIASSRPVSMVFVETTPDHGEPWRALIHAEAPALPVVLKHN
jgi:hypothetical protein